MVSVLPTQPSQNFCINKHFILSIDPKHTLKWLAGKGLLCPLFNTCQPHKGKNVVVWNDREKGRVTTSYTVQQIPVTPSIPVHFGLSNPPSMRMPNSPAALMKPLGPAKGLYCKGEVLLALCYSWTAAVNATDTPLCDHLIQSQHPSLGRIHDSPKWTRWLVERGHWRTKSLPTVSAFHD